MAAESNAARTETASPDHSDTPDVTQPKDAAADATKPLFSKQDVSSYVEIGVTAALEKIDADYELRFAALNARLTAVEAENQELKERLESAQMDAETAQTAADERLNKLEQLQVQLQNAQVSYVESFRKHEKEINDLEQYSRRSHLRIRGLHVQHGETYKRAVARFCSSQLRVDIHETDLDDAHPLPSKTKPSTDSTTRPSGPPPPPTMIVRFHCRDQRDAVLRARKVLKNQGIVVAEDLTQLNQALLKKMKDSNQFTSSWSWMGKIYGIPTGQTRAVRINIHDTFPSS
jgi:hypothetical protein